MFEGESLMPDSFEVDSIHYICEGNNSNSKVEQKVIITQKEKSVKEECENRHKLLDW